MTDTADHHEARAAELLATLDDDAIADHSPAVGLVSARAQAHATLALSLRQADANAAIARLTHRGALLVQTRG